MRPICLNVYSIRPFSVARVLKLILRISSPVSRNRGILERCRATSSSSSSYFRISDGRDQFTGVFSSDVSTRLNLYPVLICFYVTEALFRVNPIYRIPSAAKRVDISLKTGDISDLYVAAPDEMRFVREMVR